MLIPSNVILANSHITIPIGAATDTALASTNKVLSNNDLTIILLICGFLQGGSSKINEEGAPFKRVLDNILEINSVNIIPKTIIKITASVDMIDDKIPVKYSPIKIVAIVIKKGNLPVARNKCICDN